MSILKKNILALALVAGLGLAANAAAYTIETDGDTDPVLVASFDIASSSTVIGVAEATVISLDAGDFILGRTVGFTIRYNLQDGANFGAALTVGDLAVGSAAPLWTASIAAGGAPGDTFVVINLNPPTPTSTLTVGPLLTIATADTIVAPTMGQRLKGLTTLQTNGNIVNALVQFVDPVTTAAILPEGSVDLLKSGDPIAMDCDAGEGNVDKTIDVGSDVDHPAKTYFSWDGTIGDLNSEYINLGQITADVANGFTFDYLAGDLFTTVVSGDFSAFAAAGNHVFLASNNDCLGYQIGPDGVIDNTAGTVTFNYTLATAGGDTDGFTLFVCAEVAGDNTTVIDDSTVSVVTTFSRDIRTSTGDSCTLLPLRYNGSVVEVYHINPANNPTTEAFLRVINPGDAPGLVTITGIDDSGNDGADSVTFTIPAFGSKQVNSADLENGNAAKLVSGGWGPGTGKWRAVVTGEFANMVVQSMQRNLNDFTVTNLTDSDNRGEQYIKGVFNDN